METVSVIMPVYNNAATLLIALESIRSQSYRPIEICIVNDASTDNSIQVIQEFKQQHDTPELTVKIQSFNVNQGAGVARQHAVDMACGRFIAFLDADDLWKPQKLQRQVDGMQEKQAAVCYSAYEIFTEDPKKPILVHQVFTKLSYKKLLKANYIGNLTGIYDSQILGKLPISKLRKRQDWAMWIDALQKCNYAIGIQEPLASYRTSHGMSSNKWGLITYNYAVYRKHLKYPILKSYRAMLSFLIEQFFVKKRLKKSI